MSRSSALERRKFKFEKNTKMQEDTDDVPFEQERSRNWAALEREFGTEGYREGMEQGKQHSLQEGFNAGLHEGVASGSYWGELLGLLR
jgi:flagellar biosynthesis/type III secretory pathway protein FliH